MLPHWYYVFRSMPGHVKKELDHFSIQVTIFVTIPRRFADILDKDRKASSMKNILSDRVARGLAWSLVGAFVVLATAGLTLQVVTGSPMFGAPWLIAFIEPPLLFVFALVGALIVSRNPRQPVGWIWISLANIAILDYFAWGYASYGYVAHPGSLPGVAVMIVWLYVLSRGTFGLLLFTLLLLLFPNGHLPSRRWRTLAWITLGAVFVAILASTLAPEPFGYFPFPTNLLAVGEPVQAALDRLRMIASIVIPLCVTAAAISLFLRLRRARGVERQQLKWFVYAAAFMPPGIFLIRLGMNGQASAPSQESLIGIGIFFIGLAGLAVASAIAIFRYRLWDIDIIIRRTLIFGLLTGALALVYFSSVVLFGQIFQTLTGQQSPLEIVLSTLAIAALFSPLRRRIQNFIDRRFYRRKYDAQKTLANFATVTRDQIDLNELTAVLLGIVQETMQPERLSLWLKERSET